MVVTPPTAADPGHNELSSVAAHSDDSLMGAKDSKRDQVYQNEPREKPCNPRRQPGCIPQSKVVNKDNIYLQTRKVSNYIELRNTHQLRMSPHFLAFISSSLKWGQQ